MNWTTNTHTLWRIENTWDPEWREQWNNQLQIRIIQLIDEDRFIMLGLSSEMHMFLVCHCYRENDRIRIISARKADLQEAKQYGGK